MHEDFSMIENNLRLHYYNNFEVKLVIFNRNLILILLNSNIKLRTFLILNPYIVFKLISLQ
jgi:hypothetical protein